MNHLENEEAAGNNENDPLMSNNLSSHKSFRKYNMYTECPTCKGNGKILKGLIYYFIRLH